MRPRRAASGWVPNDLPLLSDARTAVEHALDGLLPKPWRIEYRGEMMVKDGERGWIQVPTERRYVEWAADDVDAEALP